MRHLNSIFFLLALVMFSGALIATGIGNNDLWCWLMVFGWCFNILGLTI